MTTVATTVLRFPRPMRLTIPFSKSQRVWLRQRIETITHAQAKGHVWQSKSGRVQFVGSMDDRYLANAIGYCVARGDLRALVFLLKEYLRRRSCQPTLVKRVTIETDSLDEIEARRCRAANFVKMTQKKIY